MTRRQATNDMLTGLGAVVLSVAYYFAIPYCVSGYSEGHNISGRTIPYLVAGGMALIGVCLTARSALQRARLSDAASSPAFPPGVLRRTLLYVLLIVAYILGLTYVGFIVSTSLALFGAMHLTGARRYPLMAAISVVTGGVLYALFTLCMEVYFPAGWLW